MIKKTDLQEEMFSQLQTKEIFEQAKSHAFAYMNGVRERNVYPTDQAIKNLGFSMKPCQPGQETHLKF